MTFWPDSWAAILVPNAPIAELIVRGTAIYFFLIVLMRVAGRRLFAQLSMADVLMMIVLAVAVRDGITGPYETVGDAAISTATILAWNKIVDVATYLVPALRPPLRHAPLRIIEDGRLIEKRARRHLLTEMEIRSKLRGSGVDSLDQVRAAYLEPDGTFSVVKR